MATVIIFAGRGDHVLGFLQHAQPGELGRIVVKGTPSGATSVVIEVAGDADDPMTPRRREVLEPLSFAVIDVIGPGRTTPLPPARPGVPVGQVAGAEVRCVTCGAHVALFGVRRESC